MAIPLWVSVAGREAFRTPKLALFRAEGILCAALLILVALHHGREAGKRWSLRAPEVVLPLLIVIWTIVATVVSPERRISSDSLLTVTAGVAIWLVALDAGRTRSMHAAWFVIAPALVNAAAIFVEMRHTWDVSFAGTLLGEFSEESLARVTPVGFMGNRDDLATLLVPAAVLAGGCALASIRQKPRVAFGAACAVLVIAVVATKTLTAIAAVAVAALVMAFLRSWRVGFVALALVSVLLPAAVLLNGGLRSRVDGLWRHVRAGEYDKVLVGRITPNLAALGMIRDHPLAGVGPGLFGKRYCEYRIEAAEQHPSLVPTTGYIDYFVDAHNDQLQLAAEAGVVAYAFFLAALGLIAAKSFGPAARDRLNGGRLTAAPLAAAVFVMALLQFPLQVAAVLQLMIVSAGLCAGWSSNEHR